MRGRGVVVAVVAAVAAVAVVAMVACGADAIETVPMGAGGSASADTDRSETDSGGNSAGTTQASASASGTTTGTSDGTTSADTMTGGSTGQSGSSDGSSTGSKSMCPQADEEPNADESSAAVIPNATCNGAVQSQSGTLDNVELDQDWLVFDGLIGDCPNEMGISMDAAPAVGLCLFVECLGGGASLEVVCTNGNSGMSPDGREGCCGMSQVDLEWDCNTGTQNAAVYVHVRPSAAFVDACTDYTLTYQGTVANI